MRLLTVAFLLAAAAFGGSALPAANVAADISSSSSVASVSDSPFAVANGAYDSRVAMEAIYYAKAAYCPSDRVANWTCAACNFNSGMTEVNVFTARETQAYVGYDAAKNIVVVAIRGSSNIQNWIDNLNFELVPYPPCSSSACKVHKGFYDIYKALSVNMVPYVTAALARHPTAPLFVTGHSLGGALATLSALELIPRAMGRPVHVYNFGEPRVGDPAFVRHATAVLPAKQQYRVVHKDDPVPKLPFREFGYLHVQQEVFYDNDGNTTWVECKDSATAEDPTCSDARPLSLNIGDHLMYLGVRTSCTVSASDLAIRGLSADLAAVFNAGEEQQL